jgi:hypothetical protein
MGCQLAPTHLSLNSSQVASETAEPAREPGLRALAGRLRCDMGDSVGEKPGKPPVA